MQNQMAMGAMANGPGGAPMSGMPKRPPEVDPRDELNTYIYDYFLRNKHISIARAMIEGDVKLATTLPTKTSPDSRTNGVGPMDDLTEGLPRPQLPMNQLSDNSFLHDWWTQFWDIYQASRNRSASAKGTQYIAHTRNLSQMQNENRTQRIMMNNTMNAQYQTMMQRGMANGGMPNDLKRAAMNNRNPNGNPMANMGQMKNPAMMAAQMQRDGSGMDLNGPRPQSPSSNENAPSPNKRPRVEGGMNVGNMQGNHFGDFAQQNQHAQQKNIEAMNAGVQGSPMTQPGLDGQQEMFAGNPPRNGMPTNAPGAPQGNHALQDYQMQLMLLEQQNKKRLLMARQEQDNIAAPHQGGAVGGPGFPGAMSPQGNRPGPSPNPTEQMKRGTPKLGQQGLPGSPMPEGAMQPNRGSPAPNMTFDPSLNPPGMPPQLPQFYGQMPQPNQMMRPPSSHPGPNFAGGQMSQQQMEAIRNGQMPNGAWRSGPPQPGMMPGQPMGGPMAGNPQQRSQMPPPPAPSDQQPRPEPSPSQSNQAPPTPNQSNKAGPKKKNAAKNDKKPPGKKGSTAGVTPSAAGGEEPPTPTASTPVAPIAPGHKAPFNQGPNGQAQGVPQPTGQQQPQMEPPFGNIDADPGFDISNLGGFDDSGTIENFDFDSFLVTGQDSDAFADLGNFDFNNATEVGGEL